MRFGLGLAALLCAALVPDRALALFEYPARAVNLVIAAPAGDSTDLIARITARGLARRFGQRVIAENHPAAIGNVAAARVAKAPRDGHTLLVVTTPFATSVSVYPNIGYHPERDFTPVARLAAFSLALAVHASRDARSVTDLLTMMRARPGRVTIGSAGSWTTSHLAAELMKMRAGWLSALHVPYKGNAQVLAELMGAHIDACVATVGSTYPHVRTGRLRALAVASPRREPALPQVPTFVEAGFPGFEAVSWSGIVAPAGIPYDTVVRLNLAVADVMRASSMQPRFAALGAAPVVETPEAFRDYLRAEIEKWAKVVKYVATE